MNLQRKLDFIEAYRNTLEMLVDRAESVDYVCQFQTGKPDLILEVCHGMERQTDQE